MSWLRLDDGFTKHPKFEGWKPADRWAWLEVMEYCARYSTEGRIPADLTLLPRACTPALLARAEASKWCARGDDGALWINDWSEYNPKDPGAAERMRRYRSRNTERNALRNGDSNAERNEPVTRARTQPRVSRPVRNERDSLSLAGVTAEAPPGAVSLDPGARGGGWDEDDPELARQAAWEVRSRMPDVHSPQAFVQSGMRSGTWPDPFVAQKQINGPVTAPACELCGIGGGTHAADCEHAARVQQLGEALEENRRAFAAAVEREIIEGNEQRQEVQDDGSSDH